MKLLIDNWIMELTWSSANILEKHYEENRGSKCKDKLSTNANGLIMFFTLTNFCTYGYCPLEENLALVFGRTAVRLEAIHPFCSL